jgi:membrane-bound serine protease (ClpP class)
MFHIAVLCKRLALALIPMALVPAGVRSQEPMPPRVVIVPLEDQIIHPVTQRFLVRAMQEAADQLVECVIIQLDTPGGRLDSAGHIVKEILNSEVPVVVYVAPSGARAGSAGVFIALSAHLAVMAPGTNIGAAHPVALGGGAGPGGNGDLGRGVGKPTAQQILSEKITGDSVAYARALAQYRGRNADWAARAAKDSVSTPANEALQQNVIDFLAADLTDLFNQLDGRTVVLHGERVVLHTKGAVVQRLEMSWPERLLSLLANPTLTYLLVVLGIAGLALEFAHPGIWIPGILGLICLILALFAMQMLLINYAGLALIVLGLLLVLLELKVYSYGMLTAAGIIGLLLGSAMLIEPVAGVERVSWLIAAPVSIALALIMLLLVSNVVRAHRTKVQTGMEGLIGAVARVRGDMNGQGYVYVAGELWKARCDLPLQDGETVCIQGYEGLTLYVKPAPGDKVTG